MATLTMVWLDNGAMIYIVCDYITNAHIAHTTSLQTALTVCDNLNRGAYHGHNHHKAVISAAMGFNL